jgi:hypothetical protein
MSITIESTNTIKYLSLNGVDYSAIVYNGILSGPVGEEISVMDAKSISGINGALVDIVSFYKTSASIIAAFNSIVQAFGPPPNCDNSISI